MSRAVARLIVDLEPSPLRKLKDPEPEERKKDRDRIRFLEGLLKDANADTDRANFNLTFLQHQYEKGMKEAKDEIAHLISDKMALQNQMESSKWKNEKLTARLKDLEEVNKRLIKVKSRSKSSIVRIPLTDEPETLRTATGLDMYCQECGNIPKNTLNVPCGHMTSCNICVENRKIDIGRSLRFMVSDEKFCLICKTEIRKIVMAYIYP